MITAQYQGNETFYLNYENALIKQLKVQILYQSDTEFRVVIKDLLLIRWEIPEKDPFPYDKPQETYYLYNPSTALYRVDIEKSPFSFKVVRLSTDEILFDTSHFSFIYSD